ncbi:MAG: hypothetical protein ABI461_17585, partial [Polyangiaceae bacterium]
LEVQGEPVVITPKAAFRADGGRISTIAFDHPLLGKEAQAALIKHPRTASGFHLVTAAVGDLAYAGSNHGEFGGTLYRIEIRTGHVEALRRGDGTICGGDYNPDCDPVTAIVPDPSHLKCVLVGVGLVHFGEQGKLLRVCDRDLTVAWPADDEPTFAAAWVFESLLCIVPTVEANGIRATGSSKCVSDPYADVWNRKNLMPHSQAVFDLATGNGGVWLATATALYFSSNGNTFSHHALPSHWEKFGGIAVASDPDVSIVLTDLNAAHSLSGATPLVAPFDGPNARPEVQSPIGKCFSITTALQTTTKLCLERTRWVTTRAGQTAEGPASWIDHGETTTLVTKTARIDFHSHGELFAVRRAADAQPTHEATVTPMDE